MKRLALAGCVVGLLLFGTGSASAETVSLGSKQDTSTWPSVFIAPENLERAESFVVTVTAEPVQAVQFQDYVSCTRGAETISLQSPDTTVAPPFTTTILPTLAEPDMCWIDASAETTFEKGLPGTVKIEVTGNRRPAPAPVPLPTPTPTPTPIGVDPILTPVWVICAAPGYLKSGRTEAHGGGCKEGRRIATKAWRKPARLGKHVKVFASSCRRLQQGHEVTIHCADPDQIVKVKGRLR